jgi:hypothetical protein
MAKKPKIVKKKAERTFLPNKYYFDSRLFIFFQELDGKLFSDMVKKGYALKSTNDFINYLKKYNLITTTGFDGRKKRIEYNLKGIILFYFIKYIDILFSDKEIDLSLFEKLIKEVEKNRNK